MVIEEVSRKTHKGVSPTPPKKEKNEKIDKNHKNEMLCRLGAIEKIKDVWDPKFLDPGVF